jgi:Starch-binding associating with outer membrane
MKKLNIKIWAGAMAFILLASSCEDYLDVNTNPNQATRADVQLVLPQAIVATASVANQFNSYGQHFGGYMANAGGFSGFGTLLNYNLQPGDYNGLWTVTYQDPLADLKYIIDETEGVDELSYFNAAAKILSVYNYQKLVDTFGDIPYEQALRGEEGILAPEYTPAADVYTDMLATLDEAIALINTAEFPLRLTKNSDPLFGAAPTASAERPVVEQMVDWQKFANTLKLKMLVRLSTTTNVTAQFAALTTVEGLDENPVGFLSDDAIAQPGYDKNRPNPTWNSWGRTPADALSNSSRIPTTFSFAFYSGQKISDAGRGETMFVNYPLTPTNQLGNEVNNPTIVAGQVTWASNQTGLSGTGVLKSPSMGRPLMLLAEAKFLQAEAELEGYMAGTYTTTYYEGITASFAYLYKNDAETVTQPVAPLVASYLSTNDNNRLVEIETATTDEQRLEAIITQKYVALNMVNSDESYNEFRRTGYPVTIKGGLPQFDIASNKSAITSRPDNLPTVLQRNKLPGH